MGDHSIDPKTVDTPPGFGRWPDEQRIAYLQSVHNREVLVQSILEEIDMDRPENDTAGRARFRSRELAKVYDAVRGGR
jgi:hypothetical protein